MVNEDKLDNLIEKDSNKLRSHSVIMRLRDFLNREIEFSMQLISVWVLLIFLAFGFISIDCVSLSQDEVAKAQIHMVYMPGGSL